jgi:hypothetical protein
MIRFWAESLRKADPEGARIIARLIEELLLGNMPTEPHRMPTPPDFAAGYGYTAVGHFAWTFKWFVGKVQHALVGASAIVERSDFHETAAYLKGEGELGRHLKERGQEQVGGHNEAFLRIMRAEALRVSKERGQVTSDDLRLYSSVHAIYPKHQNAWGAIFCGKGWKTIGRVKSIYATNHAREIKVWRFETPPAEPTV